MYQHLFVYARAYYPQTLRDPLTLSKHQTPAVPSRPDSVTFIQDVHARDLARSKLAQGAMPAAVKFVDEAIQLLEMGGQIHALAALGLNATPIPFTLN